MERIAIKNILIVDLYEAIEKDDPGIISKDLSYDDFEELVDQYISFQKQDTSIINRRIETMELRAYVTLGCLYVMEQEGEIADKEMLDVLREQKWKIETDTYPYDVIKIRKSVTALLDKVKRMKNERPEKKKADSNEKVSIFELLASMGASLDGIYLDPRKVVVPEFSAYQNTIDRKSEAYEKLKK